MAYSSPKQLANTCVVQLADQRDQGTLDADCIKLAKMASTVSILFTSHELVQHANLG